MARMMVSKTMDLGPSPDLRWYLAMESWPRGQGTGLLSWRGEFRAVFRFSSECVNETFYAFKTFSSMFLPSGCRIAYYSYHITKMTLL